MRSNRVKALMRAGQKAFGCRFTFASPEIVEVMGSLDFDYILIDGEHGSFSLSEIEEMCRAAELVGLTPVARVPNIEVSTILRFLDRGVMGILGPHIATRADAESLVSACLFPPEGQRSFGSVRSNRYGMSGDRTSVMARWNEEMLVHALIDDAQGMKNLQEILGVQRIDVISVGHSDLAQSLGHPGQVDHPDVVRVLESVRSQIRTAGKAFRRDVMVFSFLTDVVAEGFRGFLRDAKKSG